MKFNKACKLLAKGHKVECYSWPSYGPKYIHVVGSNRVLCDEGWDASSFLWGYSEKHWKLHAPKSE